MLTVLAGTGIGTAVFHRALAAQVTQDDPTITAEMIKQAEWISGTEFSEQEREQIARSASRNDATLRELRDKQLGFDELPAVHFRTLAPPPDGPIDLERSVKSIESRAPQLPESDSDIAMLPVTELAALIRTRQLRSVDLTELYLNRLRRYDPMLKFVVTLTEELAMQQATQADREIAAGRYRGVLHGIPWGAKDLISVAGYPTTWGIPQFRERQIDQNATVAQRLAASGAVLVAKLSLGAIAQGDRWFGGMTRNPWNPEQGSSGSSAGSASATVAGCVGFALGSETLGSIVSPARRCGATGLRPTFGRVSRQGCMPLSWTMDKIGPLTRSVEDCAIVFAAIHGADGLDPTAEDRSFRWPSRIDLRGLRVGYSPGRTADEDREDLRILKELGCRLVEIDLPSNNTQRLLTDVIDVEAASVFDQMLRAGETEGWNTWPNTFRSAQFMSAIDYLRILRHRRKLMFEMEEAIAGVDVLVNTQDLVITNLTGHPSIVIPQGYREREGKKVPFSTIFTGHLNGEEKILALAHSYQQNITAHLERPPLEELLKATEETGTDDGDGRR